MRVTMTLLMLGAGLIGCGDTSTTPDLLAMVTDMAASGGAMDMAKGGGSDGPAAEPTLVVDNTLMWCQVTVTIGSGSPTVFTDPSKSFMAASGTTVMLNAIPVPGSSFKPVKWTGVTTMNGAAATYTMTGAASQTVTACCALSDGSGC